MNILNNFKEIRITPNEDNTLKVECYGVKFKDNKETLTGTVIYPRINIYETTNIFNTTFGLYGLFNSSSTHKQFDVEILPDSKDALFNICISEETE